MSLVDNTKLPKEITDKYLVKDNTFLFKPKDDPKDRIETEIGDSKTLDSFLPQVKIQRWDNEVNFSARLVHDEMNPVVSSESNKIKWSGNKVDAVFYDLTDGYEFEVILKEKPVSNIVYFTINTKGLKFLYQPELTQAEIENGDERPDDVINSYAVYVDTEKTNYTNSKEYRSGKVGHIFRPKIIDAAGNWVWGELTIDEKAGVLMITVPQSFLDSGLYPIIVDPTFGYTTAGASREWWSANNYRGIYDFSPASDGTVSKFSAYAYEDRSGDLYSKGVLLLSSNQTVISNGVSNGALVPAGSGSEAWYDMTFGTEPSVTSATNYILAMIVDSGTSNFGVKYDVDAGITQAYEVGQTYASPTDWTSWFTSTNRKYSLYATYGSGAADLDVNVNDSISISESITAISELNVNVNDTISIAEKATIGNHYEIRAIADVAYIENSYARKIARTSNGDLYVVYNRHNGIDRYTIRIARSQDNGQTWSEAEIYDAGAGLSSYAPTVAIDSNDNIFVLIEGQGFTSNPSVKNIGVIKGTWGSWGSMEEITDSASANICPTGSFDSENNLHIAWYGLGHGVNTGYYQICYVKRNSDDSYDDIIELTDIAAHQLFQTIQVNSQNDVYITWTAYDGAKTEIYLTKYTNNTETWGSLDKLTTTTGHAMNSCLAIDSNDNLHLTYKNYDDNDIKYRMYDGSWSGDTSLAPSTYAPNSLYGHSSIVVDADDNIYVACNADDGSPLNSKVVIKKKIAGGSWLDGTWHVYDTSNTKGFPSLLGANHPKEHSQPNVPKVGFAGFWLDVNHATDLTVSGGLTFFNDLDLDFQTDIYIQPNENVSIAEDTSLVFAHHIDVNDAVSISENVDTVIEDLVIDIYDGLTILEGITEEKDDLIISVNDSITTTENITMSVSDSSIDVSDNISIDGNNLTVGLPDALSININDSVSISEGLTDSLVREINVNDSISINENVVSSLPDALSIDVYDDEIIKDTPSHFANFNGSTSGIEVTSDILINTGGPYATRSISLFFNANDVSTRQVLYEEGGGGNGFNIYLDSGKLYVGAWSSGQGWTGNYLSTDVVVNNFYWVQLVYGSSTLYLYLNGKIVSSTTTNIGALMNTHGGDITIGYCGTTKFHDDVDTNVSGFFFNGYLYNLRLYNEELSSSVVLEHYKEEYNDETNLIVKYLLESDTIDSSPNGIVAIPVDITYTSYIYIDDSEINVSDSITILEGITEDALTLSIDIYDEISVAENVELVLSDLELSVNDNISIAENVSSSLSDNLSIDVNDNVLWLELPRLLEISESEINIVDNVAITESIDTELADLKIDIYDSVGILEGLTEDSTTLTIDIYDNITTLENELLSLSDLELITNDSIVIFEGNEDIALALDIAVNESILFSEYLQATVNLPDLELTVNSSLTISEELTVIFKQEKLYQNKSNKYKKKLEFTQSTTVYKDKHSLLTNKSNLYKRK